MSPPAKFTLITLAEWANDRHECFLSIDTLSRRTCFCKRAVIDAVAWLERGGFITAERSFGRHTRYTVLPQQTDLFKSLDKREEPVRQLHQCSTRTGRPSVDKYTENVDKSVDKISQTGAPAAPPLVHQLHPIYGRAKIKSMKVEQGSEQKLTKLNRSTRNRPVPKAQVDAFARKLAGMVRDSIKP